MQSLTQLIDQAIISNDYETLSVLFSPQPSGAVDSWHNVGQGEKRSLAAYLIVAAVKSSTFLPSAFEHIEHIFVAALSHLPSSGVENANDNTLRKALFHYHLETENYVEAARILGGMRIENDSQSTYYLAPEAKADVYVNIAECFLMEEEVAEADAAVNKAGMAVAQIPRDEGSDGSDEASTKHRGLLLRYKSTYARVLDANRKFLNAAVRYLELSQPSSYIDAEESLQMLGRACTCAVLAPFGPQRQRTLGNIYKDPRLASLSTLSQFCTHASILTKMYRQQILRPNELLTFESTLAAHQKAVMGDGLTIMERGVVEHNMIAVANTYNSIYFVDLARVLGVTTAKAEKIAATMILEGSLKGTVDQVDGLLEFAVEDSALVNWNRSINSFCVHLNHVADAVKAEYDS